MSTTLEAIENLTKGYSGARRELAERVTALREEQEAAKRRRLQGIKNALDRLADAHEKLKAAIAEGRALFVSPKTRLFHGVKVGWMKQKGEMTIADEGATIAALRKQLGREEASAYIRTSEKPIRAALLTLTAEVLKKCGVALENDTDAVLIKAQDAEIDKLVDALLGDAAQVD